MTDIIDITEIKPEGSINNMTRPLVKIDWNRVSELLEAGCLGTEVAAYYGVHPNTFYRRVEQQYNISFSDLMQQKRAKGDSILREVQYKVAIEDKDKGMLIWLGKQRLNQREPEPLIEKELAKGAFNLWWNEMTEKKVVVDVKSES